MEKVINVTLAIKVNTTDLEGADNIVNNLDFRVNEESENVEVLNTEVVDFFEVH